MLNNGKVVYNGSSKKIKDIDTPIIKRFLTGDSDMDIGVNS